MKTQQRSHVRLNCRPTTQQGYKIHPSRWEAYREAHAFRYPCCLCAKGGEYVEVVVFPHDQGVAQGEYVAECTIDTCGYMGELASKLMEWTMAKDIM